MIETSKIGKQDILPGVKCFTGNRQLDGFENRKHWRLDRFEDRPTSFLVECSLRIQHENFGYSSFVVVNVIPVNSIVKTHYANKQNPNHAKFENRLLFRSCISSSLPSKAHLFCDVRYFKKRSYASADKCACSQLFSVIILIKIFIVFYDFLVDIISSQERQV